LTVLLSEDERDISTDEEVKEEDDESDEDEEEENLGLFLGGIDDSTGENNVEDDVADKNMINGRRKY
jgi:hypothetical protein